MVLASLRTALLQHLQQHPQRTLPGAAPRVSSSIRSNRRAGPALQAAGRQQTPATIIIDSPGLAAAAAMLQHLSACRNVVVDTEVCLSTGGRAQCCIRCLRTSPTSQVKHLAASAPALGVLQGTRSSETVLLV